MERLSFDGSFCDIAKCAGTPGGSFCENGACSQRKVWERLKDYEGTGLTTAEVRSMYGEWQAMMSVLNSIGGYDRLRELAEADKDGRVVLCLERSPTADVVPVGRCRDCAKYHAEIAWCEEWSCFEKDGEPCDPADSMQWRELEPDEYCSRFEKKEETA